VSADAVEVHAATQQASNHRASGRADNEVVQTWVDAELVLEGGQRPDDPREAQNPSATEYEGTPWRGTPLGGHIRHRSSFRSVPHCIE
jgi:hypothetical protein